MNIQGQAALVTGGASGLGDLLRADAEEWRRLIKQIGFTAES